MFYHIAEFHSLSRCLEGRRWLTVMVKMECERLDMLFISVPATVRDTLPTSSQEAKGRQQLHAILAEAVSHAKHKCSRGRVAFPISGRCRITQEHKGCSGRYGVPRCVKSVKPNSMLGCSSPLLRNCTPKISSPVKLQRALQNLGNVHKNFGNVHAAK